MESEEKLRITGLLLEKIGEKEANRLVKYLEKFHIDTQGVELAVVHSADMLNPKWELSLCYRDERGWIDSLSIDIDRDGAMLELEPSRYPTGFDPV